jgi:peptidoglycan/xylan/chitin deacetylase (PgdA/CDA1 family)
MHTVKQKLIITLFSFLSVVIIAFAFYLRTQCVIPILMYHHIDGDSKISKLSVAPESFQRQMEFLYKHKYNVVSLERIADLIKRKEKIPSKTLAITFDDGYKDNYTYAYPVLKKYGFTATVFVIVSHISGKGNLSWDEVIEMSNNRISIGSHGMSHSWLPDLNEERLKDGIAGSKRILESKLNKEVNFYCYPGGGFNDKVKQIVKEAGYRGACATNPGKKYPKHDPYALKRLRISSTSDNLFVFWIETSGFYTWIKEHRDED